MKVLFVQEHTFLSTALHLTLLKKGYTMIVSDSTIPAGKLIEKHSPEIVIADISKESAFLYVEEAKKKNVPILVISKNGKEENLQKAFDKGADDYITMPVSMNELALRVNLLTQCKRVAIA